MTIEELKQKLIQAEVDDGVEIDSDGVEINWVDPESLHSAQDKLLLEFINDPEVTKIFNRTTKWYA